MEHSVPPPSPSRAWIRHAAVFALIVCVSALMVSYFAGAPEGRGATAVTVGLTLLDAGWMPALYLLASYGVGRVLLRRVAPTLASHAVALALGVAGMLTLTHLLGWLGLLGGSHGPFIAWASLLPGCVPAVRDLQREVITIAGRPTPSRWWWGVAPAYGLVLACACSPPGWLWSSEFGGYDALSYHLQLPHEWMQAGRVRVLHHNVYSALPSYIECAFLHMGQLMFPRTVPDASGWGTAMLAGDGRALLAAQLLHAMLACVASLATGSAVSAIVARVRSATQLSERESSAQLSQAGAVGAAIVAWTPWTIVTGSLAYNEMGVLFMGAACIIVLAHTDVQARRRWLLCALLIGAACGAKPTALLMLGVPGAIVLLASTPRRDIVRCAAPGAIVGLLMLCPWMMRNAIATRNPVFPFAAAVFASSSGGTGHWSREQVERFAGAHRFDGTLSQRLGAAVLAQPDPGNPQVPRHRGVMHPQWGWLFPLAVLGLLALIVTTRSATPAMRAFTAISACALLVQLALWLLTTHVQSRFLLPVLPTCALILAVVAGVQDASNFRAGAAIIVVGLQALASYHTFVGERAGAALGAVVAGPVTFTGEAFERAGVQVDDAQLAPDHWINLRLPPTSRVLLVGDATPLYLRPRVSYATTYDENMLVTIMRQRGDDPAQWSIGLRESGIDFVVLNLSELARLERSGFLDPALSPAKLKPWLEGACVAARAWPQQGKFVLRPVLPEEMEQLRRSMQQGATPPPVTTPAP